MRAFTVPRGAPSRLRNLCLCQPGKKGQVDRLALAFAELGQSRAHTFALVAPREGIVCAIRRAGGWKAFVSLATASFRRDLPLPGAQAVDRLVPRNHYRPGKQAAPARIVGCGAFPHLHERFLEDVLGFFLIAQDSVDHRKKAGRKLVVKGGEGVFIASCSAGVRVPHRPR